MYASLPTGINEVVRVIPRHTLQELAQFGASGWQPRQVDAVHPIATGSTRKVHIAEAFEGDRLHTFVLMGAARVPPAQGRPWPR